MEITREELFKDLKEFEKVIYGNSPDTKKLDSYKGLVKNQLHILKSRIGLTASESCYKEMISNRKFMLDNYDLAIKTNDDVEIKTLWRYGKEGYRIAYEEVFKVLMSKYPKLNKDLV